MEDKRKIRGIKEQEVSEVTGLALSTLRKYRHYGTGIPYFKLGSAVRYDLQDVYDYLQRSKVDVRG